MPRLPPSLLRQARSEHPLLTLLLRVCRDLPSARNELRWLREHAHDVVSSKRYASQAPAVSRGVGDVETVGHPEAPGTSPGVAPKAEQDIGPSKEPFASVIRKYGSRFGFTSPPPGFQEAEEPFPITKYDRFYLRKIATSRDLLFVPTASQKTQEPVPIIRYDELSPREVETRLPKTDSHNSESTSTMDGLADGPRIKYVHQTFIKIRHHGSRLRPEDAKRTLAKSVRRMGRGAGPSSSLRTWTDSGERRASMDKQTGEVLPVDGIVSGSLIESEPKAWFEPDTPTAQDTSYRPTQEQKKLQSFAGVEPLIRAHQPRVDKQLKKLVKQRSRGMPLQYIMGNQPFGSLDILCRKGVLIPRPDTEVYTAKVAKLVLDAISATCRSEVPPVWGERKRFRILDLCSGSGCIALLLHSILRPVDAKESPLPPDFDLEIKGIDVNPDAIALARTNLDHNVRKKLLHRKALREVSFSEGNMQTLSRSASVSEEREQSMRDFFNKRPRNSPDTYGGDLCLLESWDMVIANPPYVSPEDYALGGKVEPSVRDYEPKDALVPSLDYTPRGGLTPRADLFYLPLLHIATVVNAQLLVMEVGDSAQATRVAKTVIGRIPQSRSLAARAQLEVWRDDEEVSVMRFNPTTVQHAALENKADETENPEIHDRAVVLWLGTLADWRRGEIPKPTASTDVLAPLSFNQQRNVIGQIGKATKEHRENFKGLPKIEEVPDFNKVNRHFLNAMLEKWKRESAGEEVKWNATEKHVMKREVWTDLMDKQKRMAEEVGAEVPVNVTAEEESSTEENKASCQI